MIDREKMLDLFVQQAGSMWKHNKSGRVGVFFYYDEYNAVLNLIRTAPDPEDVKRLVDFLQKKGFRSHAYCEDSWYSCPKAEDGCANESRGTECDCGSDEYNAELRAALAEVEKDGGK